MHGDERIQSPSEVSFEGSRAGAARAVLAARTAVLGLACAALSWELFIGEGLRWGLQIGLTLAAFFAFTACSFAWLERRGVTPALLWAQTAADISLATYIIGMTGGPSSPFLFLYLPVVMSTAILWSRRAALIGACVSVLAYIVLTQLMLRGTIPAAELGIEVTAPTGGLVLQIVGLFSAAVLIAVATSYLIRAVRFRDDIVAASKRDIHRLATRHEELMDSLPDGFVTVDASARVVSMNRAARVLLRLGEETFDGVSLRDLIVSISDGDTESFKSDFTQEHHGEFGLRENESLPDVRVAFRVQPLPEVTSRERTADSRAVAIVSFQDVTKLRSFEEQLKLQDRMARLLANADNADTTRSKSKLSEFVGESVVMQKVFSLIERVAPSDATVLIHGESGTGKELVARAIHAGSGRSHGPFIAVNCGAIPETLLESELFGHKRGAFTGAVQDHEGVFRRASGGTLFLDEIGELPVHVQAKLLRAIQERTVRPVGADREVTIDVRIVAATNRNLRREIEQGNFREDLYYRLNVIGVSLPPLRERREDVLLLINSILKRLSGESQLPIVPPETVQILANYNYPGNVRELENILERAYVMSGNAILPEHLPDHVRFSGNGAHEGVYGLSSGVTETKIIIDEECSLPVNLDDILGRLERRYLEVALLRTKGAKKKAAELLGINFRSFRYRLQKFGISDED